MWLITIQIFVSDEPKLETNLLLSRKPTDAKFKHIGYMFTFYHIIYGLSQRGTYELFGASACLTLRYQQVASYRIEGNLRPMCLPEIFVKT